MNDAQIAHYLQPGRDALAEITDAAKADVLGALVAAVVYPQAQALADAFEGAPMEKLRQAAAEPLAAVAAAQKALDAEKASLHTRLAAFHSSPARKAAGDREHPPAGDTPRLLELQAAFAAAEQAATPFESKVRSLGYLIDKLRGTRPPDPTTLAVLAAALVDTHKGA